MTPEEMMYIGTRVDNIFKEYLLPESKAHKARYNLPMLRDILERWSEPGQLVLDPMMGIGSILIGLTMGRRVIGIEIEPRWYDKALKNREYLCSKHNCDPAKAVLLNGDAASILPIVGVDMIVFSPVYGKAAIHDTNKTAAEYTSMAEDTSGYGHTPGQIADYAYPQQRLLMRTIYKGCYDSLKQGGRMITVTRNFYEGGRLFHMQKDITIDCARMGFQLEAVARRQANPTGLQNLQRAKRRAEGDVYEPITYEDVTVFRRETKQQEVTW